MNTNSQNLLLNQEVEKMRADFERTAFLDVGLLIENDFDAQAMLAQMQGRAKRLKYRDFREALDQGNYDLAKTIHNEVFN
jgi:hypothetical protein